MNKDLFSTPKDALIAQLKCTIQRYKEYDKKRSISYKRVYKELKWYKEEYSRIHNRDEMAEKVRNQHDEIAHLHAVIEVNKYKSDYSLEDLDKAKLAQENTFLKLKLHEQTDKVKNQKKTISDLITKLNSK